MYNSTKGGMEGRNKPKTYSDIFLLGDWFISFLSFYIEAPSGKILKSQKLSTQLKP